MYFFLKKNEKEIVQGKKINSKLPLSSVPQDTEILSVSFKSIIYQNTTQANMIHNISNYRGYFELFDIHILKSRDWEQLNIKIKSKFWHIKFIHCFHLKSFNFWTSSRKCWHFLSCNKKVSLIFSLIPHGNFTLICLEITLPSCL